MARNRSCASLTLASCTIVTTKNNCIAVIAGFQGKESRVARSPIDLSLAPHPLLCS